ncbi:MAG: hypothetical protein RR444_10390 [Oscillospiraceae bacterium]
MKDLEVGQVLSLKIRYNNTGVVATSKHPYLIVEVDDVFDVVEIAQIDSLAGKEFKAAKKSNKTVFCDDPQETVIDKDSYIQLDNSFKIEYFDDLSLYRRQADKLSTHKLADVLSSYNTYHETHEIEEIKNVYMDKGEIFGLNP